MNANNNGKGRKKREKSPFNEIFRKLVGDEPFSAIADKIGTSRQTVTNWLNSDKIPDISTLARIANAYDVSTDYLLGRSETQSVEYNPTSEDLLRELLAICNALNLKTQLDIAESKGGYDVDCRLCLKIGTDNSIICQFMEDYSKIKPLLNDEKFPEYIRNGLIPSILAKYKDYPVEKLKDNAFTKWKK